MLSVEIITIGSELLDGRVRDKNSTWLGEFLRVRGLALSKITVIPDESEIIQATLASATKRSQVVFVSGGLGPTEDDKTKSELAKFFDRKIVANDEALKITKDNYARRNKDFVYEQNTYPQIPEGFKAHTNPAGFAPGLSIEQDNLFLAAAPGVPREFEALVEQIYFPIIENKFSWDKVGSRVCIRTFGIPEGQIFFTLCPGLWQQLEQFGTVSSLPRFPGVNIWISSTDLAEAELEKKIREVLKDSPLQKHIWQIGPKPFERWIVDKMSEKNLTLATAESCTGGLISSSITDVSGSSKVFQGTIVSYANEVKMKVLGVKEQTLIDHGAVSVEVAEQMAAGAQKLMATDYALSTTGIAGPSGGTAEKPVGTVCLGVATPTEVKSFRFEFKGDRDELKQRFASMSKLKLVEELLKL